MTQECGQTPLLADRLRLSPVRIVSGYREARVFPIFNVMSIRTVKSFGWGSSRSDWTFDPARPCAARQNQMSAVKEPPVWLHSADEHHAGVMFALIRNRLVGSKRRLSIDSCAWLDPYDARIFSGESSVAMWFT